MMSDSSQPRSALGCLHLPSLVKGDKACHLQYSVAHLCTNDPQIYNRNGREHEHRQGCALSVSNGSFADRCLGSGDKVSWNWGSGQPSGKVESINAETTTVESKRGNEASLACYYAGLELI
ncbi:uncharacterized protein L969DRAFT_89918 [Mixia osmundae IAM 14324]|uniref:uncharacterized protein n=1 Tax=Mixia osmundae (strain CBS 9802 / IAM 14324 / JCM 22182 / KY 12970) TaxID=764103 RepID=UPI0004A5599D|nr:uncharacterized protein L969DRAFT_89918 [Mixia osmundae IAM 14324]KEI37362.1 hypothetical protein L969DRAFT_89918 [Mixia osmundae IAM 14324]